jgi:hypothetical protein
MAPSPESRVETADPDSNPNANTPMLTYNLFLLAHVLLFVYWLGGDIGVFYSSRYVADPSLSVEARTTALRIMAWIDEIPRICLVMILPVGVMLGYEAGWLRSSPVEITTTWIVCIAWLAMVFAIHHYRGTAIGNLLRRIDMGFRVLVILALGGIAVVSLAGGAPIEHPWLAGKLLAFALCVACGLAIRLVAAPFGEGFARLATEGSSPEIEDQIGRSLARARPFVIAIWILLVVAAYLGLAKPYG